MEVSNQLVSWVITYLGDLQPTFIGVIIHLLSTMDIPVGLPLMPNPGISKHLSERVEEDISHRHLKRFITSNSGPKK